MHPLLSVIDGALARYYYVLWVNLLKVPIEVTRHRLVLLRPPQEAQERMSHSLIHENFSNYF